VGYKNILNVVEDARIEKKMKRRYPGLRQPMYNGYNTLVERDFFGCKNDDMNDLPFADRVNLYFKLGARSLVKFNKKEQNFVDRVELAETWEDSVALADELYDHAKDEMEKIRDILGEMFDGEGESEDGEGMMEGGEGSESSDEDKDISGTKFEKDLKGSNEDDGEDEGTTPPKNASGEGSPRKPMSQKMREKLEEYVEDDEPTAMTDEAFAEKSKELVDKSAYPFFYAKMPILDIKKWVIPAKVTHAGLVFPEQHELQREEVYSKYMLNNKNYISFMVKEFELKRNAKQFAKARVSKTGDLDINKIWKHKISEDLFMQSTIVPDGKNHGVLMMIDMSGSMGHNISGTLEQMISLAMFCRKVNIPFDSYGFFDNGCYAAEYEAAGIGFNSERRVTYDNTYENLINARNDIRKGALCINDTNVRLKQFLHSKMRTAEFSHSVKNLLLLASAYDKGSYYNSYGSSREYLVPGPMQLGGTPLDEAIVILRNVAEKFREETGVEILNTIILSDGDACGQMPCYTSNSDGTFGMEYVDRDSRMIIEDERSHTQIEVATNNMYGSQTKTLCLLQLYKEATKSRVVGFFLAARHQTSMGVLVNRAQRSGMSYAAAVKQYKDEFQKNKFFGLKQKGYDTYYILPGENLEIHNATMDDMISKQKEQTKGSLQKAFMKMQRSKAISRVFLSRFIKEIA
jgi:hypothetical protein